MTQRDIQEQKSLEQHRSDNAKCREINTFQICVPNIRNNYLLIFVSVKGATKSKATKKKKKTRQNVAIRNYQYACVCVRVCVCTQQADLHLYQDICSGSWLLKPPTRPAWWTSPITRISEQPGHMTDRFHHHRFLNNSALTLCQKQNTNSVLTYVIKPAVKHLVTVNFTAIN